MFKPNNINSPLYYLQNLWVCSSELWLLQFIRVADHRSRYESGYVSNFFLLRNFVTSSHRSICDTSMKCCDPEIHFLLHLRVLSNLKGRYDLKNKKKKMKAVFWPVTKSFFHMESNAIPLLKALISTFISSSYADKLWEFKGTLWPQNWKIAEYLLVTVSFLYIDSNVIPLLKAVITIFDLSSYTDDLQANLWGRYYPKRPTEIW